MQTLQRHPKNEVFGLVDRPEDVKSILQEVERRGVAPQDVQVIRKEGETETPPAPSEHHGRAVDAVERAVDKLSEEHEFNELYESRVEAGGCLVGIPVSESIDKDSAHDILHEHGAHDISYYGRWVVEEFNE